ncbi:TatD family hydrolase [Marinilabiliaceae bacterium ANBcel2]|nr:TatD family hydrolase [Marinilabiliaceae bacterium ANBcel2]
MIDTHSHIYSKAFNSDREEMIKRAVSQGVNSVLMPNIDSTSIDAMLRCEERAPKLCKAMMGLHPTSVKKDFKEELKIIEKWVNRREFIAIGETGLDLYHDTTFINEQKEALKIQLKWAVELDIPIVLHVRDAFNEVFDLLSSCYDSRLKGVFHSFSGNIEDAKKALSLEGFYLGINGTVTYKNSNLPNILKETGYKKLMFETDAPYLSPVPKRGKRNEPSYINYTVTKAAEIFNVKIEELTEVTDRNAKELFNL